MDLAKVPICHNISGHPRYSANGNSSNMELVQVSAGLWYGASATQVTLKRKQTETNMPDDSHLVGQFSGHLPRL